MPSPQHEDLCRLYAGQLGLERRGFRAAVRKLFDEIGETEVSIPNLIPDGWRIVQEDGVAVIQVYEVEVGQPLDGARIRKYARFWWEVDATGDIDFELYTVDRFGDVSRHQLWVTAASMLIPGGSP